MSILVPLVDDQRQDSGRQNLSASWGNLALKRKSLLVSIVVISFVAIIAGIVLAIVLVKGKHSPLSPYT